MNYRILFNLGVNIVSALVILVLLIISIVSGGVKQRTRVTFSFLMGSTLLYALFSFFTYLFRGDSDINPTLNVTFNTLSFAISYLTVFFLLLYVIASFDFSRKLRFWVIFSSLLLLALFLFILYQNIDKGFYFRYVNDKIIYSSWYIGCFIYPIMISFVSFFLVLSARKRTKRGEKIAFYVFTLFVPIASLSHYLFKDLSIFILSLVTDYLFHYLYFYIRRGMMISEQQNELSDQQARIMISQIQPHFIYNCLSSISYLITQDQKQAVEAIDDFSYYLRVNFSNMTQSKIIPFEKELEHTERYLRLEKMRFEDRVNVKMDIRSKDFSLPSLSLQPIVENAVKHGICKKIDGGTVVISTWETLDSYMVKVSDDGVGFDSSLPIKDDDRVHVGIKNVGDRIERMCGGEMTIDSVPNKGTTVVLKIPKNPKKKEGK